MSSEIQREIWFVIVGQRMFAGKYAKEGMLSGKEVLVDSIEFLNLMNQRGDVNITGYLLGDMDLPQNAVIGRLSKDSPYFKAYYQVAGNLKLN